MEPSMTEPTGQIVNAFSIVEQKRTEKFLTERDQNIEEQKAPQERARIAREEKSQKIIAS